MVTSKDLHFHATVSYYHSNTVHVKSNSAKFKTNNTAIFCLSIYNRNVLLFCENLKNNQN